MAKMSVYDGLRALPWERYLVAMWLISREVRAPYESRLSDSERALMNSTLNTVRRFVEEGSEIPVVVSARDLAADWSGLLERRGESVMPGQWNLWSTFMDLAAELGGGAARYSAAERVGLAATEIWREPYQGRARRINIDEEIDDASPMAQTLAKLNRVVNYIRDAPQLEASLDSVKSQIML